MKKHSHLAALYAFGLSVSTCMPMQAQTPHPADTITGKVHAMDEVKVKGTRRPRQLSATSPVQVMTGSDLQNLGIQNLADAVKRFAGVNVRDYGGIGGLKTVSVRSLGAAHTAVSYDGIVVGNAQAGQIDLGRFPLDHVNTISLAVGQADDLLQSARSYASAGILNIQTAIPHFDEGQSHSARFQAKGGSFGYAAADMLWNQKLTSRTRISLHGNFMRADGNYPFTLKNGKYVTDEKRNNSDINSWNGEANLIHTFKDQSELDVKSYYFYSRRGLPGSVTLYNPQANERLWDENFFAQALYRKSFSERWQLHARAKYNHAWNKYTDKDVKYQDGMQTDVHRQDEYYLSATALYRPTSFLMLSLAQDGFINKLRNNLDDCPYPTRYTALTAFNAAFRMNRWNINASVINTYITEDVKSGKQPDNRERLSPSLSVNYRPLAGQLLYIRALYKSTFRVPTFNDLYYQRIGNRSLRPEKANEYNLGVTYGLEPHNVLEQLHLTLDGYYNEVSDKIVAFPTTYVWKMANFGKVRITGIDATLAASFRLQKDILLKWNGSFTWQKAIDLTDPAAKNYKEQIPYTPKVSGSNAISLENPWVNLSYSLTGVGERYYMAQNLPENRIDGYVEQNITCWKSFAWHKTTIRLQAEVLNLGNRQYDIIKYYPMPGRHWRLGCTLDFLNSSE